MSILYLRLPCRASHDAPLTQERLRCSYAWATAGRIERHGVDTAEALSALISAADKVVLLLAGTDVTLLQLPVPPMAQGKLKSVLPHLVEEHLLSSAEECHIVLGEKVIGSEPALRQLALLSREWLEDLVDTFKALGAQHLQVLPVQLCIPGEQEALRVLLSEHGDTTAIALRLPVRSYCAWLTMQTPPDALVSELQALAPAAPLNLYVPAERQAEYAVYQSEQVVVAPDDEAFWHDLIGLAERASSMDLMAGLRTDAQTASAAWQNWRWPLRLALCVLLLNSLVLNLDWWKLSREARTLRQHMVSEYRTAFPNETVVVDPLLQTKQKISLANQAAGAPAAGDFLALISRFTDVWQNQDALETKDIAGLEYRDGALLLKLQDAAAALEGKQAMAERFKLRGLTLTVMEDGLWKIGNRP